MMCGYVLLKGLNHENVIQYHDAFSYGDAFFMAMEVASGGDLAQKILEQQKIKKEHFSTPFLLAILCQIASGVGNLHDHKIMHRDLKPANILVQVNPDNKSQHTHDTKTSIQPQYVSN